jgi:NAD(P)-dependent dehydrogenase (short-subunit alcohol dehydrogenase family)
MVRAVLPGMRARRRGAIINLSSVAGFVSPPYAGFYAASKHAVEGLTESLHYEVSPFGIRVALIEPGGYVTGFQDNRVPAGRFDERSPYWQNSERYHEAWAAMRTRTANDPQEVADAIYEAATTEAPKLRWLCGADANLIATVRKQTDFEAFEKAMRQTLNWFD